LYKGNNKVESPLRATEIKLRGSVASARL